MQYNPTHQAIGVTSLSRLTKVPCIQYCLGNVNAMGSTEGRISVGVSTRATVTLISVGVSTRDVFFNTVDRP